jgi:hypothetical protein
MSPSLAKNFPHPFMGKGHAELSSLLPAGRKICKIDKRERLAGKIGGRTAAVF